MFDPDYHSNWLATRNDECFAPDRDSIAGLWVSKRCARLESGFLEHAFTRAVPGTDSALYQTRPIFPRPLLRDSDETAAEALANKIRMRGHMRNLRLIPLHAFELATALYATIFREIEEIFICFFQNTFGVVLYCQLIVLV